MASPPAGSLNRQLCLVVGINDNYTSRTGTLYHIQVEDRGPILDRSTDLWVRRLNLIVYANYGEPNARIVHGSDHDFEDVRSHVHNQFIQTRIRLLARRAHRIVEAREAREVERIKGIIRRYFETRGEDAKRQIEAENATFPFLFSRAWRELKEDRAAAAGGSRRPRPAPPADETRHPLNPRLRERLQEIERMIAELNRDLESLRGLGNVDDILLQTCRKLVARAREVLASERPTDFDIRRLDKTRASLITTCRQVKSRLKAGP